MKCGNNRNFVLDNCCDAAQAVVGVNNVGLELGNNLQKWPNVKIASFDRKVFNSIPYSRKGLPLLQYKWQYISWKLFLISC